MHKKVFITTKDIWLAQTLIGLLYQHDIDAYLVTEEEGEKLARVWQVDAWVRDARVAWRN